MFVKIDGFKEVDAVLRELPNNIGRRAKISAGRAAAKPIVKQARALLNQVDTETTGNLEGFEHLRALAKITKTVVYKGGVNVQVDPKAGDIPMASNRSFWSAYPVGRLFAFGRFREKGTGSTTGVGDWVDKAGRNLRATSQRIFKAGIEIAVSKGISKTIARYGK